MPEPGVHPDYHEVRRVARISLVGAVVIMGLKFVVFGITSSAAVLSDALESIINVIVGVTLLYTLWLSQRPPDPKHPYGHGKVEFLAAGLEAWLILLAAGFIVYEAISRLFGDEGPRNLVVGVVLSALLAGLNGALALYVYRTGKKHDNLAVIANGKHLFTDVASTLAVMASLLIVHIFEKPWLDPVFALLLAGGILWTGLRLLWDSFDRLLDRSDPDDDRAIRGILDEAVATGEITDYHKVRLRHNGPFHWVDLHLQMKPHLTVVQSHQVASRIERAIEAELGGEIGMANATAHVEPDGSEHGDHSLADRTPDDASPHGSAGDDSANTGR